MGMVHVYTGGDPHGDIAIALEPDRWREVAALLRALEGGHDGDARSILLGMVDEALSASPEELDVTGPTER